MKVLIDWGENWLKREGDFSTFSYFINYPEKLWLLNGRPMKLLILDGIFPSLIERSEPNFSGSRQEAIEVSKNYWEDTIKRMAAIQIERINTLEWAADHSNMLVKLQQNPKAAIYEIQKILWEEKQSLKAAKNKPAPPKLKKKS